ncbi:quinone oxidoreductase family protein [Pseudomonas wayambapalatensis]|uniref:quinone oxidoreductase family protein n=1 Tax=Pseudomonas wayambapalatensis TaxID=485895 RepID=UPI003CEDEF7B
MKTLKVYINHHGGPEALRLGDTAIDAITGTEVLVRNHAIGVNYIDTYFRSGLYPPPALPSGLGTEGAGVVIAVGADVHDFVVGDRVAYVQSALGAYSTYHVVDQAKLVPLPADISFDIAAGGLLKGLTAVALLTRVAAPTRDDTVLFYAAAGGVGSLACQLAARRDIKLIGVVSSTAKADLICNLGAAHAVLADSDFTSTVRVLTHGKGANVVYDSVGRTTWSKSLASVSRLGHIVSFGNASGPVEGVNLADLAKAGSVTVSRPILFDYIADARSLRSLAAELFDEIRHGLQVRIGACLPLEQAADAHRLLESRSSTGSVILRP